MEDQPAFGSLMEDSSNLPLLSKRVHENKTKKSYLFSSLYSESKKVVIFLLFVVISISNGNGKSSDMQILPHSSVEEHWLVRLKKPYYICNFLICIFIISILVIDH